MKGKRVLFIPQNQKMSAEYEAQVKHFFEVTQHKLIAKYGANVSVKGELPQPTISVIPPKPKKQRKPKFRQIKKPSRLYTQMQKDVMSIS